MHRLIFKLQSQQNIHLVESPSVCKKISPEDITSKTPLARGGSASVMLCHGGVTSSGYAIKKYYNQSDLYQEQSILSRLNHPNIINLIAEYHQEGIPRGLVLEYAKNGDFYTLLEKVQKLPEAIARFYFRSLIWALEYIHGQGIAHRDLKLENLMIDSNYQLKIADFGASIRLPRVGEDEYNLHDYKTTFCYAAPEVIARKAYSGRTIDIFAAGIILFTMMFGKPPFMLAHSSDKYYRFIASKDYEGFWDAHREADLIISAELQTLMNGMLTLDPKERMTLDDIKDTAWFTNPICCTAAGIKPEMTLCLNTP